MVTIWLDESEPYLDAQVRRESAADAASLRPRFRPEVVAVVGAGRGRTSIGHAVDLNPVMIRPDGVMAADARIRLEPNRPRHPYLRALR